jgi:RIO-like serine/threonine protein kinase
MLIPSVWFMYLIIERGRAAFLDILSGIHEAGVLHCDLSSQNLLVNEFGEATIIDFDQPKSHPLMEYEYAELVRILDGLGAGKV